MKQGRASTRSIQRDSRTFRPYRMTIRLATMSQQLVPRVKHSTLRGSVGAARRRFLQLNGRRTRVLDVESTSSISNWRTIAAFK